MCSGTLLLRLDASLLVAARLAWMLAAVADQTSRPEKQAGAHQMSKQCSPETCLSHVMKLVRLGGHQMRLALGAEVSCC
jgi:hypothetical protein